MDTTSSSCAVGQIMEDEQYISCIKVDGQPILPPLMNDAKRTEMRYYRQLAIEKERTRQFSRQLDTGLRMKVTVATPSLNVSTPLVKNPRVYLTSTPNNYKRQEGHETENAQEVDVVELANESSDDSADNLASEASSTGTFIINKYVQKILDENPKSDSEVDELDDEGDDKGGEVDGNDHRLEPQTVLRRPFNTTSLFKRKRPARYFDTNEDEEDSTETERTEPASTRTTALNVSSEDDNACTFQTGATSSTSLSKYMPYTPTLTPTPVNMESLPNTLAESHGITDSSTHVKISPTFTINTNFAEAALSKKSSRTTKQGIRRTSASKSRKSLSFESISPESPSFESISPESIPNSSCERNDVNFDFILTKEIPKSATKDTSSKNEEEEEKSCSSDCSDKENHNSEKGIKRHIRKLSYTLLTPSAALLAASGMDQSTLPVITSAPSSIGISSVQTTPMKGNYDMSSPELQIAVTQLQQLNLGKGKKAHLERYLGELESDRNTSDKTINVSSPFTQSQQIELQQNVISKIEMEFQTQLESLMASYKQQEQKIREDFEKEKLKVMFENKASHPSSPELHQKSNSDSITVQPNNENITASTVLSDTSNLRNYYISNNATDQLDSRKAGFADNEMNSEVYSCHHVAQSPTVITQEKISTVGLSKFQNKMQKINPTLLKHPGDIRSPLLKGLVFPDPLERPSVIPKIPSQAHDAEMKPKFDKLTAWVKGYLTRRLLHTEKTQIIVQTIRDTVELLLKLYEENPPDDQGLIQIKEEDQYLHHRLIQQLTGACSSFHDIFFKISTKERMAIISNNREKMRAKALKNVLSRRGGTSPSKRNISSATLKSIERRQTQSPNKKDNPTKARFCRATLKPANSEIPSGSQTVKPKGIKSYNVSPKRRRMSFWDNAGSNQPKTTQVSSAKYGKLNNNTTAHRPNTAMPTRNFKNATTAGAPSSSNIGWGSNTYLVPSDTWTLNRFRESQEPTSSKVKPSMTRMSVGVPSTYNNSASLASRTSNSVSRAPWKK